MPLHDMRGCMRAVLLLCAEALQALCMVTQSCGSARCTFIA